MTGRATDDIVADLRRFAPLIFWNIDVASATGGGDPAAVSREAADRLAELDKQVNVSLDAELTAYETELARIDALLPDGVPIERLVKVFEAVHNSATWVHHSRDEAEIILRGIR